MKNGLSYLNLRTWNKKSKINLPASLNLNKSSSLQARRARSKNKRMILRVMGFLVMMNSMLSPLRLVISLWLVSLGLVPSKRLNKSLLSTLHLLTSHTKLNLSTVTKVTLRAKTSTTTQIINVFTWRPLLELFLTQKRGLSRYLVVVKSSSSGASSRRRANLAIVMTSWL